MPVTSPILVAVDPRGCAAEVVDWAADLARDLQARVTLLTAVTVPAGVDANTVLTDGPLAGSTALDALEVDALDALHGLSSAFIEREVPVVVQVVVGDPVEVVVERAAHARFVVVGTHGRRGLNRLLFGSVAEGIVRRSPVPVLTVRSEHGELHESNVQFAVHTLAEG